MPIPKYLSQVKKSSKQAILKPAKKTPSPKSQSEAEKPNKPIVLRKHKNSRTRPVNRDDALRIRELAKIETRRKLLAAARKLFVENGYHVTRPRDITNKAKLGYGTFYDYFENKLQCYIEVINDAHHELLKVIAWHWPAEEPRTPTEHMHVLLPIMFGYSAANPGLLNEIMSDTKVITKSKIGTVPGLDLLIAQLTKWQKAGDISSNLDVQLFSYVISGIVKLGSDLLTNNPDRESEVIEVLTQFIGSALESKKPSKKKAR